MLFRSLLNTVATAATAAFIAAQAASGADPAALVAGFTTAFSWSAAILVLGGLIWFALVRTHLPPASTAPVEAQGAAA